MPIAAHDMIYSQDARLIYDSSLNGGSGVFILLNPFLPISGDGSGGITTSSINGYALGA